MPLLPRFDPPANIADLDPIANGRAAWSETVSVWCDDAVRRIERSVGAGKSQFVNPSRKDLGAEPAVKEVTWLAFPLAILARHNGNRALARAEADQKPAAGGHREHDEYCEWHVTTRNNKIVRVDFTCEGPEYWEALAHGYPESVPASKRTLDAQGDKTIMLNLYRQFVSPDVQMADLFSGAGQYNPLNKWNTSQGAMHLTHPANSLQAEIVLGADATVRRKRNDVEITDAKSLICCAKFGEPLRASDPTIGSDVNTLARQGRLLTLQNPIALYIKDLDTQGWTTPDGANAKTFWKIVRGTAGAGLRATFEVPAANGYSVSDIKIGGVAIQFGGQIAEKITVKLTGVAGPQNARQNPARGCAGGGPLPGCTVAPTGRLGAPEELDPAVEPSPRLRK